MSENLSTKDISSEDLDLNSNAVSLEDQDGTFRVCGSVSSATISVSAAETLAEEGGHDEVRVSDGDCPEPLTQGCDVRVEGKFDDKAAQVDSLASREVCGSGGGEKGAANEVVEADGAEMIANSAVQTEAAVEGEVASMDIEELKTNNEVSSIGTLDEHPSSSPKEGRSAEADEVIGACTESCRNEDLCCQGNDSIQEQRLEVGTQVDEIVSNPVDGNGTILSQPVEESKSEGQGITNASNSVPEASSVAEAVGVCTSPQNESDLGFVQVTNPDGDLTASELDSKVQVTESLAVIDKEQKNGIEAAKMETSMVISESMVEHVQVFVGGRVAITESKKVAETSKDVSQIDALDTGTSCPEEDQRNEAEVPGRGTESLPNGDLVSKNNPCLQDMKEETSPVAEMASNQVDGDTSMDSHIVEENLHREAGTTMGYMTVNPVSLVERTDEIVGGEVAPTVAGDVDVSETKCDTSEVNPLVGKPISLENIPELEAVALGGGIESLPEGSPRSKESTPMQNVKQCVAIEVAGTLPIRVDEDESKDSQPVEENLSDGACVILDQIPLVKDSDGSRATGSFSSQHLGFEVVPPLDTVSVGPLEDGNSNSKVQIGICHTSLDEEHKVGTEVEKVDCSTVTTKTLVQSNEDSVRVVIVVKNNEEASEMGDEISQINAQDGNPGLLDQKDILKDDVLSVHESIPVEDVKQNIATEVVSTANIMVDGQAEINSLSIEDNLREGAGLTVESDSHLQITDICQASGSAASLHGEDELNSTQVTSAWDSEKDISNSQFQVAEGPSMEEGNNAENEVVKVESETGMTELLVEQVPLVEGQAAVMEELPATKGKASVTDDLGGNCTYAGKNQLLEDVVVGSAEPAPNGDLSYQGNMSEKDEEQERVSILAETGSSQVDEGVRMDSCPVVENLDGGACDAHIETEAVSAYANIAVESFTDVHLDSEVQVTEGLASPTHKDQIMRSYISEIDTSPGENEDQVEAAGGSFNLEEKQTAESNVSAMGISLVSGSGEIIVDLVEGLESFPSTDGNLNAGGDAIKEDVSLPSECHAKEAITKEMSVDMGFSVLNENAVDNARQICPDENENLETPNQATGFQQLKSIEKQCVQSASDSEFEYAASYYLAPEKEDEFSVSDLVWGKVKSHPWWPGQVFDSSDSSEQALRYQRKDSYLVAYFGDQTFAWNDVYSLKPFRTYFPQMEKQSSSETFRSAVDCALNEVQRRVELGTACSCTPKDAYTKVKTQVIENAGIREEARRRDGVDESLSVYSFEPDKLVLYIKALGLDPCGARDRLELVVAQAQLKAFYFLKGFDLPEFYVSGGFSEADLDSSLSGRRRHCGELFEQDIGRAKPKSQGSSSRKRKHVWEDGLYPIRKEKGLSELMAGNEGSSLPVICGKSVVDEQADTKSAPSSSVKRKAVEPLLDDSAVKSRKEILSPSRDADTESPAPQSFKVGECIRRIASKLTGSPPILKCVGDRFQKSALKEDRNSEKREGIGGSSYVPEESQRRRFIISKECSSPEEMLSQLCLAARDPIKGYSFLNALIAFFTDYRNSICLDISSSWKHKKFEKTDGVKTCTRIRTPSDAEIRSAKTFDFEDMSDSYWTDRVIQSSPEEQPCMDQKRKGKSQVDPSLEAVEPDSSLLLNRTSDSNQQDHDGNHDLINEKPSCKPRRRRRKPQLEFPINMESKQQNCDDGHDMVPGRNLTEAPTALILSFSDVDAVPSEMNLNKIFTRFGPLKESETEVMRDTGNARVVFKRRTDAEVACSSAGKFSIFGPTLVTYQLMYLSPTALLKSSFHDTADGKKDASVEGS